MVAPLIAEVGGVLRRKLLEAPAHGTRILKAELVEPAYERLGGLSYQAVCAAMAEAQERYMDRYMRVRAEPDIAEDLVPLHRVMSAAQARFSAMRAKLGPLVAKAQAVALARRRRNQSPQRIPDTFFGDVHPFGPLARLQRIHPPWWGRYMVSLRRIVKRGHPAEGFLLDALAGLRERATKKTLEAVIDEWFEENGPLWHWTRRPQERMLARRAVKKAAQLGASLDLWSPGFRSSEAVRLELAHKLVRKLSALDPWADPRPNFWPVEPGRN